MAKILIVEDDPECIGMVEDWLTHEHYTVDCVTNGTDGRQRVLFYEYDLIILDWDLPGQSGIDICKEFRDKGGATPILMLTGRSFISDKEGGLDAGADDYLTKPFHLKELSARVRALIRRSAGTTSNVLKVGDLTLEAVSFRLMKGGEEIPLQRKEFLLLEFLMRNPNRVFSPEALIERVWSGESDATTDAIRTCVMRIRKKIDPDGNILKTVHGVGYKLQA